MTDLTDSDIANVIRAERAAEREHWRAINAELLEALIEMINLFERSLVDPEMPELEQARAAIAKATGEV